MRARQETLGATLTHSNFSVREFAATVHHCRERSTRLCPPPLREIHEAGSANAALHPAKLTPYKALL